MLALLRRPIAFTPVLSAVFLLALIGLRIARYGPAPQADEGTEAHLFQLLMPLNAVLIVWFAATWLPRAPKSALGVLAVQSGTTLAVLSTVLLLRW